MSPRQTNFDLKSEKHAGWWLYTHPSEKYDFVNWDDDYSQLIWENSKLMATKPPTSIVQAHILGIK